MMAERLVEANGVELCTEAFGNPGDPPILLVMGIGGGGGLLPDARGWGQIRDPLRPS